MSIASDKLEAIREQVQFHLDHAEQTRLSPAQVLELKAQITARLLAAGHDMSDLNKMWSGNVLRLLRAAEEHAANQGS